MSKIAFCTTCKDRVGHIEKTLPRNLADNDNRTFIVLDYNSPDNLLDYLQRYHMSAIQSKRIVVYSYRGVHPFRMAHAKNMAHRLGMMEGCDVLVNLDADNYTGPGFARYIDEQMKDGCYLWARMIKTGEDRTPRGISGRIVVSSRAFLLTGGYNERFDTWAPDDKDFNLRLARLGFTGQEIDRRYLDAVLHTDRMRFKEYKHVKTKLDSESDEFQGVDTEDTTVVNFGRIGLGVVYRNFDFNTPLEIKPLPTRIFGIGMHKTATTSLHEALKILGFDSAHWQSAHWAKAIYDEIMTWGHSHTLEKHYAVCDLPIPLLYRQLDVAYPGSKFILTTRGEQRWLNSVKNHWNPELNKFRRAWDTDPFTHRIHRLLYDRKSFDAEIFLARYRRHNAEVREYFQARPNDLLVMDMDRVCDWSGVCDFLDRPIPNVAYPLAFVTDLNMHVGDRVRWVGGRPVEQIEGTVLGVTMGGGLKVRWDGNKVAYTVHAASVRVIPQVKVDIRDTEV